MPADEGDVRELLAALRRMGLLGPSEQPCITPLAGGVSSLIVRVDTAGGPVCVKRALARLKVAAVWEAPVERNRAEVAWMRVAAGIHPRAVPAILGDDAQANAFAMAYLEPADFPVWKAQLRDGIIEPATAEAVAALLVDIHARTAGDADAARAFANDASFHALRLQPYFVAAAGRHPDCAARLHRLVETTANHKRALVHGDVSPKNILVGPDGPVILDAECAWYGDPAFDIAFCLTHLLLKSVWRPASTAALLQCFVAFGERYLAGVAWEPRQELEARTVDLVAGMLLARVDGKSPVEYLQADADKQRVRSVSKALLLRPPPTLDELAKRWSAETP